MRNSLTPEIHILNAYSWDWGDQRIAGEAKISTVLPVNDPMVSIILRSYNEGWALRGTLEALQIQKYPNWELIAFDSGSTDGSLELLRQAHPRHLVQSCAHGYIPGRVLNQGMRLACGDFGIFLNADATPQGPNWLRPLVEA